MIVKAEFLGKSLVMFLLGLLLYGCGTLEAPAVEQAIPPTVSSTTEAAPPTDLSTLTSLNLFTDASGQLVPNGEPSITRARLVKINRALLLDAQGRALKLSANAEVMLNLFPDVTYTAIIDQVRYEAGVSSWVGHLKGIQPSEFTMVYTAGVFAGHFASPGGVYEVSSMGNDLYRIIQINQNKLPGGEG